MTVDFFLFGKAAIRSLYHGGKAMKHCEKCGNTMRENNAFCPNCGAKQRYGQDQHDSIRDSQFTKYMGLSLKGIYRNTIDLTPQGVHMYRTKSLVWRKYDKLIPIVVSEELGIAKLVL